MKQTELIDESKNSTEERIIGQLRIDDITSAPLRLIKTARLNLEPKQVFKKVSDHTNLHQWIPMIEGCFLNYSQAENRNEAGVGLVRICKFGSDFTEERIVHWDPPHIYAFSIINDSLPISDHLGLFTVEWDRHDRLGGSFVTWHQYFNTKNSSKGLMMSVKIGMNMNKALKNLIDEFGGEMLNSISKGGRNEK